MQYSTLIVKASVKPLLVTFFLLSLSGCGIPGIQYSIVNVEMSSLNEVQNDQLTHGCLVKANRGSRQFEQTVRSEKGEFSRMAQYSLAHIGIDSDTDQVVLVIYCHASHPYMLKSTTTEDNVFQRMYVSMKLDIEQRFESDAERDHYLRELVRTGFNVNASAWSKPKLKIERIPSNNDRFKSSELTGYVWPHYELLGIWRQPSPTCSTGFFDSIEATIEIPPQNPETIDAYKYIDPTLRTLEQEPIYIPDWRVVQTVKGYIC